MAPNVDPPYPEPQHTQYCANCERLARELEEAVKIINRLLNEDNWRYSREGFEVDVETLGLAEDFISRHTQGG